MSAHTKSLDARISSRTLFVPSRAHGEPAHAKEQLKYTIFPSSRVAAKFVEVVHRQPDRGRVDGGHRRLDAGAVAPVRPFPEFRRDAREATSSPDFQAKKVMTRLTIISFSAGRDSAIMTVSATSVESAMRLEPSLRSSSLLRWRK